MTGRPQLKIEFLQQNGWRDARRQFLAGDASFRRYERLFAADGTTAILMDAPPDTEPITPFIRIDKQLIKWGYSAPHILAQDVENGFLLLEDLGDNSFSNWLRQHPNQELTLYKHACNLLIDMHQHANNSKTAQNSIAPPYSKKLLMDELMIFADWYLPTILGRSYAAEQRIIFLEIWDNLLASMPFLPECLVLRDFHADNLMWLPAREDIGKVGLLDFQDAVMGCPAYDIVSMLEDARRDLQPETVQIILNHYLQQMVWDKADFMATYALLGAQRNTKIIGIFTRLAQRDGKQQYLNFMPRVWQHLHHNLQHSILRPYSKWLNEIIPESRRNIGCLHQHTGDMQQSSLQG